METIIIVPMDTKGNEIKDQKKSIPCNKWPEKYEDAEALFVKLLAERLPKISTNRGFNHRKYYVDDLSDMVWSLCMRKSGAVCYKVRREKRPVKVEPPIFVGVQDNISEEEKYTYFVSYHKQRSIVRNKEVVLPKPIKGIQEIREIETALMTESDVDKPTIVNFALLHGPVAAE